MTLQEVLEAMSRALEGLSGLPWGVHLAVALALACGLVLWASGERLLKPIVIVLCAGVGAVVGALLSSATAWGHEGTLTVHHHLLIGAGLGAVVGCLVFRSAAALGLGVVLAGLLPLGAAAVLTLTGEGPSGRDVRPAATARASDDTEPGVEAELAAGEVGAENAVRDPLMTAASAGVSGAAEKARDAIRVDRVPDNLRPGVDAVAAFWKSVNVEVRAAWAGWSGRDQAILTVLAALGLAVGVIWGMSVPKWSAVLITSLFGAAVALPALVWLTNAMDAPWKRAIDLPATHWLAIWGAAGVMGMIVQYSGFVPGGKKPAPAPKPAAPKPA